MSSNKSKRIILNIERGMMHLSWSVTLFVTIMLVTDIGLRALFGKPLPASFEISEVLMPYIVMFAFPYALTTNVHVKISLLTQIFSKRVQLYLHIFAGAISLLTCILVTYWSWLRFWASFIIGEEILAMVSIPWWIGKFGMPFAFGMFGVSFFLKLVEDLTQLVHERG